MRGSDPTRTTRRGSDGARAVRALVAAFTLALAGLVVTGSPAAAHANLTGSNPEAGARLDEAPKVVTLTFNEEIDPSLAVVVVSVDGADPTDADTTVSGRVVEATMPTVEDPTAATSWRIGYRVVSADGHPVNGEIPFTVEAVAGSPSASTATSPSHDMSTMQPGDTMGSDSGSSESAQPDSTDPSDTSSASTEGSTSDDGGGNAGVIIGLVAALVVFGAGLLLVLRRRNSDS